MQFIETASSASRVAGKLTNRLSLGVTLQNSSFVISRLFLLPLLFSLSFVIESGQSIQIFLLNAFFLTIVSFFTSLLVLYNFNYFQLFFQQIFARYKFNTIPVAILKLFFGKKIEFELINMKAIPKVRSLSFKKIVASSFAYSFLSTGFLISFSLAIIIPDYRMTVSQLTTFFTGVGAIVLHLYIDPMLSRSLDVQMKNSNWLNNIYSILIGRILAYFLASVLFFIFYLNML